MLRDTDCSAGGYPNWFSSCQRQGQHTVSFFRGLVLVPSKGFMGRICWARTTARGTKPIPWIRPRQNRGSYEWNFSVNVSLISLAKPITLKTHHQILCSTAPPLIRIPNPSNPSKNNSAHHMLSPSTHLTGFVSVLLDHRFA